MGFPFSHTKNYTTPPLPMGFPYTVSGRITYYQADRGIQVHTWQIKAFSWARALRPFVDNEGENVEFSWSGKFF